MATKTMTAAQVAAIDWTDLLAKVPALAALIMQIVQLLASSTPKAGAAGGAECCDEVHEQCDKVLCSLATHVLETLKLHEACGCCDE